MVLPPSSVVLMPLLNMLTSAMRSAPPLHMSEQHQGRDAEADQGPAGALVQRRADHAQGNDNECRGKADGHGAGGQGQPAEFVQPDDQGEDQHRQAEHDGCGVAGNGAQARGLGCARCRRGVAGGM